MTPSQKRKKTIINRLAEANPYLSPEELEQAYIDEQRKSARLGRGKSKETPFSRDRKHASNMAKKRWGTGE